MRRWAPARRAAANARRAPTGRRESPCRGRPRAPAARLVRRHRAPRPRAPPAGRTTPRRGRRSAGLRRGTPRTARGASRLHLGEAAIGPLARVGLHQARVLARLQADAPRDDVRRFACAQQRAGPQRGEAVRGGALGQFGRLRAAGVVERDGQLALEAALQVVGGLAVAREVDVRGLAAEDARRADPSWPRPRAAQARRSRPIRRARVAPAAGRATRTGPRPRWRRAQGRRTTPNRWSSSRPPAAVPNARAGFIAAPVNGPPKRMSIVIVRPIASPAIDLNVPRWIHRAREHHPRQEEREDRLEPNAGGRVHAAAERRTPRCTASVLARGSRSRTRSAASAAPAELGDPVEQAERRLDPARDEEAERDRRVEVARRRCARPRTPSRRSPSRARSPRRSATGRGSGSRPRSSRRR